MPYENLRELGRLHVDPFGNLHIRQGISVGNLLSRSLGYICATYDPEAHPITGPLPVGGPAELAHCLITAAARSRFPAPPPAGR